MYEHLLDNLPFALFTCKTNYAFAARLFLNEEISCSNKCWTL